MLQTPTPPRKRRSLLGKPSLEAGTNRQHAQYMGLPAKYCGTPNYMNYRIGPGAELQEAALSYADLRWSNFRGANLRGASLVDSALWGSTLTNADLRGADLTDADFTGVDLVGTDLTDAVTKGTCFLGARYCPETTKFPRGFGNPEAKGLVSAAQQAMQVG